MTKTVRIKDLVIALEPCLHCGKTPTEDDALAALGNCGHPGQPCAVCGEPFRIVGDAKLRHEGYDLPASWRLSYCCEPFVDVTLNSSDSTRTTRCLVHPCCVGRMLPARNGESP